MAEDMVPDAVTKKIGPLPGWAWAALAVGGAWGYHLWRGRSAPQQVAVTPVADASGTMPVVAGNLPGTNTSNGYTPAGPQGTVTPTNASWAKMVADALITSGGNPTDVSNALDAYTNGSSLSTAQQSIINTALRQYGAPPQGVLPVNNKPGATYTVQAGDTFQSVIEKMYGKYDPITARIVHDYNPQVTWNDATGYQPLTPGSQLQIVDNGIAGVQNNTRKTV